MCKLHIFWRTVHYTGLTEVQVAELAARFAEAEMDLLRDIAQKAAQMKAANTTPGTSRIRAGGYFFQTETPE